MAFQDKLLKYFDRVFLFLDEPLLEYIRPSDYSYLESLNSCHDSRSIIGIHCCSRANWQKLIELGFTALSFDINYINENEFEIIIANLDYVFVGVVSAQTLEFVDNKIEFQKYVSKNQKIWFTYF